MSAAVKARSTSAMPEMYPGVSAASLVDGMNGRLNASEVASLGAGASLRDGDAHTFHVEGKAAGTSKAVQKTPSPHVGRGRAMRPTVDVRYGTGALLNAQLDTQKMLVNPRNRTLVVDNSTAIPAQASQPRTS